MDSDFRVFKPTPYANNQAKSTAAMWYRTGSSLYNCALILGDSDLTPFKTSYVGEVDARDTSQDSVLQHQKDRVIDMLIGMAIEDWLKGLILAAGPQVSKALNQQISDLTGARLGEMGKTEEVTFEDIIDAMQSPQIQELLGQINEEETAMAVERVALLTVHHNHDLSRMAAAIDFKPPLRDNHKKTLGYYSQMIELGRYPALNSPRNLIHVNRPAALEDARKELFRQIWNHCNSLRFEVTESE